VMIEAMACGTPVIAFGRGSIPEVLEDGASGFIVDTLDAAVLAVRRIASLDRTKVRSEFERRFTAERMAIHYLEIYDKLINAGAEPTEPGKVNGKLMPRALVETIVAERPQTSVMPARRGRDERSVP
jgi:Glycosyl transferases group 1